MLICESMNRSLRNCVGKLAVAFGVCVLAFASGCRISEPDGPLESDIQRLMVTDGLGRHVLIRQPVERVISLAPSITESIFAVGAGDKLVGVTTYCDYPETAKTIEKIGDTQTPNLERIVALKPDVVFVSTASQLEAFMKTLEEQGIAVYVINASSLKDVLQNLRDLGALLGTDSRAAYFANELDKRAAAVDAKVQGMDRPRVFVQISRSPLFTVGRTSFVTEIVERAGGISVTRDVEKAFPEFSRETAMASDPDVMILSDSEDNPSPNDAFKNSKAVKNGRVYRIDPDIISRPGPRLVDALEEIARYLNPETR